MTLEIERSGPALTESDIAGFEESLGRPVPAAYRSFLLVHNGGSPDRRNFTITQDGREESIAIKRLLGIGMAERTLDIAYVLDAFSDRAPETFFPIARDPGGNIVGIVDGGEGAGRVLYFDLDEESDEGATPLEKMYVVAESFEEFIDGLTE
jgi:hypothetical protein